MQNLYLFMNLIALAIVLWLVYLSYKNKAEKFSRQFMIAMIFMAIWTLGTTLEMVSKSLVFKVIYTDMVQFGMAFVSLTSYWFVIVYTELKSKVYYFILWIFLGINTLAMILLFTDPLHHLLRSSVEVSEADGIYTLIIQTTLLGSLFIFVRFLLFGFAVVLLFIYLGRTFKNMRKQVLMILSGFLLALIILMLKQYWLEDLGFTIKMSTILCIPYVFIGIGVFKYSFLSVSPMAKEWVINTLDEGIIVFSKDGKILETNTWAESFIDKYRDYIKKEDLVSVNKSKEDSIFKLQYETEEGTKYFDVTVHHLLSHNEKRRGSVLIIRDVTQFVSKQLELKEKAEFDGLTKIYNRQTIVSEYSNIENGPISMMIIDIDKFKAINDTYGHPTGDAVIIGVVEAMKKSIRGRDLIGRLGGDEFCIILIESSPEHCNEISRRIYDSIRNQKFDVEQDIKNVEVSIGACVNIDVESTSFKEAYECADKALYEAKEEGKKIVIL